MQYAFLSYVPYVIVVAPAIRYSLFVKVRFPISSFRKRLRLARYIAELGFRASSLEV